MAIGVTGWIGMSTEGTPGTPVSMVDTFFATESFTAIQSHEPVVVEANIASLGKPGYMKGKLTPQGNLSGPLSIKNASVFYWVLGDIDTTDNGDGTYTHTIIPALELPSFTVHADTVIDTVEQSGALLNKLTISAAAGEVVKLNMEWLGRIHNEGITLNEVVNMPDTFINFTEAVITLDGTTTLIVENVEITVENNLKPLFVLGDTRYPKEIVRDDKPAFTGKLVLIDWDASLYNKMINADQVSLKVKLSDPNGYYIEIEMPQINFSGGFEPEISTGNIVAEPEFEAVGDIPVQVIIYTDQATL